MKNIPEETQKEFYEIFGVKVTDFVDDLLTVMRKEFTFDIFKFGEWCIKNGYDEKDGSLSDYVRKHYGDKAVKLIDSLLGNK